MNETFLNESNISLAANVAIGNYEPFYKKDTDFQNLFLCYLQDKNSSSLRELVTLHLLNYHSYTNKHGADGIDTLTLREKEVKPIQSNGVKPIGNSGCFNDLTIDLLERKINYDVVCSLFYNCRLVYLVEFPLLVIYDKLKAPILNAKAGKRVVCQFNYRSYDCDLLNVYYFDCELSKKYNCLSKPHYQMLKKRNKNDHIKYLP
jgi:hypothetical protein